MYAIYYFRIRIKIIIIFYVKHNSLDNILPYYVDALFYEFEIKFFILSQNGFENFFYSNYHIIFIVFVRIFRIIK